MSLIRHLPKLLVGLTGVATAGYLAWRHKPLPTHTRDLSLDTLGASLENWLPKLPYVSFIRIDAPGVGNALWLTGDGGWVEVSAPRSTGSHGNGLAQRFQRVCDELHLQVFESVDGNGGPTLACRVRAGQDDVNRLVQSLLRNLYGVGTDSPLTATVPLTT